MPHDTPVDTADRGPDAEGEHGDDECGGGLGGQRPAEFLRAGGGVADEADEVIGDGCHRQAFDRRLQLELGVGALAGAGEAGIANSRESGKKRPQNSTRVIGDWQLQNGLAECSLPSTSDGRLQ